MRDLTIFILLGGFVAAALYRPWLGVLGLTILSFLHPHSWGEELTRFFPMYKVLFAAVVLSTAYAAWRRPEELQWPPRDWRLFLIAALWIYFLVTTLTAHARWLALPMFIDLSKIFLSLLLTLALINTRAKLAALIAVTALCIGLVTVKGGYWALITGFSDRVYGPPNTAYFDNNHFAIAAIVNIPLLWLWLTTTASRTLRAVLSAVIALSVLAVLSSWSRGALLSLVATLGMLLLISPKRLLAIPLMVLFVGIATFQMPEEWRERMASIGGPQDTAEQRDASAQNRLEIWQVGIEVAVARPLTGGGFRSWRYFSLTKGNRAWHSAYVQVLADHGIAAFALWLTLLLGSIALLAWQGMTRRRQGPQDPLAAAGGYLAASLVGYAVGAAFLSAAYWELPYHLIVLGVLTGHLASAPGQVPVPEADPEPGGVAEA